MSGLSASLYRTLSLETSADLSVARIGSKLLEGQKHEGFDPQNRPKSAFSQVRYVVEFLCRKLKALSPTRIFLRFSVNRVTFLRLFLFDFEGEIDFDREGGDSRARPFSISSSFCVRL